MSPNPPPPFPIKPDASTPLNAPRHLPRHPPTESTRSSETREADKPTGQQWSGSLSVAGSLGTSRYAEFSPTELAVVCSHYDLGVIRSIKPVRAGSHGSPKARVQTFSGDYLLKRREGGSGSGSGGGDDPFRVAATHVVQIHLAGAGFPVPRIIGTRGENNSMLQLRGRVYELFEFVEGDRPSQSEADTTAAGGALAQFYDKARSVKTIWEAPSVAYHNAAGIEEQAVCAAKKTAPRTQPVIERLLHQFNTARAKSDALGLDRAGLIHGDWHPGNLIVSGGRVRAVTDFDSVRVAPRTVDLANGLLQFSIEAKGGRPEAWEDQPNTVRFAAFLSGYRSASAQALSQNETDAIGPLMVQALIAESLLRKSVV